MSWALRIVGIVGVALASGCGSSNGTPATMGTATFSGAVTGTSGVAAAAANSSGTNYVLFGITTLGNNYPAVESSIALPGTGLQSGTYTSANSGAAITSVSPSSSAIAAWAAKFDPNASTPEMGSFSLQISSPGSSATNSGGNGWDNPHGMLTATMVPQPGNPSTANVTVNVTF